MNINSQIIPQDDTNDDIGYSDMPLFSSVLQVLGASNASAPAWWTPARDIYLRDQTIRIDFLDSAVQTVMLKLFSIPFSVTSKNNSSLVMQGYAEEYQDLLTNLLMQDNVLEKFIRSFLISDNGAFLYVNDGVTPNDRPIANLPIELRWLDPTRCQRTSNREYPVIYYHHSTGVAYHLHHSRVISLVLSPSTDALMNNVGLSFVSRALLLAQHLSDIYLYESEVMGTRSSEEVIYATGAKSKEIDEAFQLADIDSNNTGLTRVGKRVYLGLRDPNAKLGKLTLKNLPDKFDKRNDVEITLTLLAMASGGSPNWFFDSVKSGSTKASASESTKMGESKLETWYIRSFSHQIEQKVLPKFLRLINKNADIDTTGTRARIKLNLAQKTKLNIESLVTNVRVERQQMLEREDIDLVTFEDLELADGRTPNGLPIYSFYETDIEYLRELLYFTDNPLDYENNDPDEMLSLSEPFLKQAQHIALNSIDPIEQRLAVYAMYTLDYVRDEYSNRKTENEIELNEPESFDQVEQTTDSKVLSGMNDDAVIDNNTDGNLTKAITINQSVFSTRQLRSIQRTVRTICREYWNGNLFKQDFYQRMHAIFADLTEYNSQLISNYIQMLDTYITTHARNKSGKLNSVYKLSDQFIICKID